ncbi:MAG: S8 family serine peptidase [Bacteroidota bacterium]
MKALIALLLSSTICCALFAQRQETRLPYIENEFYFKLHDDYPIEFRSTPVVNVSEDIPFFKIYADQYEVRTLSRPFFFSSYEPLQRVYRATISNDQVGRSFIAELSELDEIDYVEYLPRLQLVSAESTQDPERDAQWYLDIMEVEEAWQMEALGQNRRIAIIDNGFDMRHMDLDSSKWVTPIDLANWDSDPHIYSTSGQSDHGTHIAGIIGAATNNQLGIAAMSPEANIIPIKAAYDMSPNHIGDGLDAYLSMGYECIEAAIVLGAHIINASWGSYFYSETGRLVIEHAKEADVIVVAAAGNDDFFENDNDYWEYFYPAAYDYVINVAGTTVSDKKWSGSNYGKWIDVAAPAHKIYSTVLDNNFDAKNGTSMASPMVAALAAIVWSVEPALSTDDVIDCIIQTTDPVQSHEGQLGSGRINARLAVECAYEKAAEIAAAQLDYAENGDILYFKTSPNPMTDRSRLVYELREDARVQLQLLNRYGHVVRTIINGYRMPAGSHQHILYRNGLPTGLYYLLLQTDTDRKDITLYVMD